MQAGSAALVALLASASARAWYPEVFAPGSPLMQSMAIVGGILLAGAALSASSKRFGVAARRGFRRHLWLALIGFVLVCFHTTGSVHRAPALMLLGLVLLGGAGLWGRTRAPAALAQSFGRKPALFAGRVDRGQLRALLDSKRSILSRLDADADEALFSLQPHHWARHPLQSWRYHRAVSAERGMLGAHAVYAPADRHWRRLHQLMAWAVVLGIAVHVILCTFFAGYVAEGREVYWWHLRAWDF